MNILHQWDLQQPAGISKSDFHAQASSDPRQLSVYSTSTMATVRSVDHAFSNGTQAGASASAAASPGGMTNGEKAVLGELSSRDEQKGAAVHVRIGSLHLVCLLILRVFQSFDPDATPEQKAEAAGKAKTQLEGLPGAHRRKDINDMAGRGTSGSQLALHRILTCS